MCRNNNILFSFTM